MTRTLAARLLAAVAAALVGLGLGLDGADLWQPARPVLVTLVVAAAFLALVSTAASAWRDYREARLGAHRVFVETVLTGALWAVVDGTGLDYRRLGLAAYRLHEPWWSRAGPRLERVHRVRALLRPTASAVSWRVGKGVIGVCVAQQSVVALDLKADQDAVWPCNREEWDTVVPDEIRLGLSYGEFLELRGKYDVVVAVPMLDSTGTVTRTVGCIALDGPEGSLGQLGADDVVALLNSTAQTLLQEAR